MRDFRDLSVWKKAMDLVEQVYLKTRMFPKEEIYGLTSQLRRAVVSVSSNIAEGCGRRTSKDFVGFLYNAMGSIKEVECQLLIAKKLGYLKIEDLDKLMGELNEVGKMLWGFIKHVSGQGVR